MQVEERIRALGFSEADTRTLADHFLDAERRGKPGTGSLASTGSRRSTGSTRRRNPSASSPSPATSAGRDAARSATSRSPRSARAARGPAGAARLVVAHDCFPTGMLGYWARRLAAGGPARRPHRDVAAASRSPRRRPEARRDEPARDRDPELGRTAARQRRLDGRVTYGDVIAGRAEDDASSPSAASTLTRRSRSRSASSCSSTRSSATATAPCCSSRSRRPIRCRRCASRRAPAPGRHLIRGVAGHSRALAGLLPQRVRARPGRSARRRRRAPRGSRCRPSRRTPARARRRSRARQAVRAAPSASVSSTSSHSLPGCAPKISWWRP